MPGIVVVGGGHGGFQTALSLRDAGFEGELTLVAAEDHLPYERPPLSKSWLHGGDAPGVTLRPASFYDDRDITLLRGRRVTWIDRLASTVKLDTGVQLAYSHLVLALGASPRPLPVSGADLDGVHNLHTLDDAIHLRAALLDQPAVVVVGGGFIGLEVAAAAREQGCEVAVIERLDRLLARVVSPPISTRFLSEHLGQGIDVALGRTVVAIEGVGGRARAVVTDDGVIRPADVVVVGTGVVPQTRLGADAGLEVDNGIVVDQRLRTSDEQVSAVGDCAAFPSIHADGQTVRLESVQNATDHARCVAAFLTGAGEAYAKVPWFWTTQYQLRLQIAGLRQEGDDVVVLGDKADQAFTVLGFRGNRLVAVESINRPADHMCARRLLDGDPQLVPAQVRQEGFELRAHLQGTTV